MAELMQELKNLKHPERSRVTVRHWKVMIDHEDVFPRGISRLLKECYVAVGWLFLELGSPCFRERRAVDILVFFRAR